MSRISYLNGEFLPHENCLVHIEDRGFQFADGVYEVTLFKNGRLVDGDFHIERLFRSLREMKIEHDFSKEDLRKIQFDLFAKNNMERGNCYLQITRGSTLRTPTCPKGLKPTINATVSLGKSLSTQEFEDGIAVMTHEDIRWGRCDIKTTALLASSLMNQKAKDEGANDMIFIRDGFITEATFANAFIVDQQGKVITRNSDNFILCGITRNRMMKIAKDNGIEVEERKFNLDELLAAKEIFLTSSSLILRPVTKVNGKIIGDGQVGKISRLLKAEYDLFLR